MTQKKGKYWIPVIGFFMFLETSDYSEPKMWERICYPVYQILSLLGVTALLCFFVISII